MMAKSIKMTCDSCGIEAKDSDIRDFTKITIEKFTQLPNIVDPRDHVTEVQSTYLCAKCFRKFEERNGVF